MQLKWSITQGDSLYPPEEFQTILKQVKTYLEDDMLNEADDLVWEKFRQINDSDLNYPSLGKLFLYTHQVAEGQRDIDEVLDMIGSWTGKFDYSRQERKDRHQQILDKYPKLSGYENVFISVDPQPEEAKALAVEGFPSKHGYHTTLAFLGPKANLSEEQVQGIRQILASLNYQPIPGVTGELDRFGPNKDVLVTKVDVPGLVPVRARLVRALTQLGIQIDTKFGFSPHITLVYNAPEYAQPPIEELAQHAVGQPVTYTGTTLVYGDEKTFYPWTGQRFVVGKISSAENLSQEILRLVQEDPAARTIVEELSPYGDIFVVGGAPRDVVLGKQPKDIDMMARIDGDIIKEVLRGVPDSSIVLTGKQFPVYRFKYDGSEVEIALPRKEEKIPGGGNKDWKVVSNPEISVEEDLERRDFTVNAIAVNAVTGEVYDPFGGIPDLEKLQLKTVSDTSFRDDTSRVMRALTQMAKHGIIPNDTTMAQMAQFATELSTKTAPELIQAELDKIMKAGNPHLAIRLAYETGVLKEFLPEVEATFGFDQKSKYHDYELGDHLLAVLEATLKHDDPDLRLAALLHDIGKPGSQWIDEEGFGHFYKKKNPDGTFQGEQHEELGADLAAQRMRDLKYPNANIDEVEFLIRNHMFPVFQTSKGARKFLQQAGSYERAKKLLALREADLTGKGPTAPEGTPADVALMHQLLDEAHENQVAVSLKDLAINGNDLVQEGYSGPEIGRKLKALLEEVIADPELNNRDTLLQMAKTAKIELQIPEGPPMPRRSAITDKDLNLQQAVDHILESGGGTFDPKTLQPITTLQGYFTSIEGQEKALPDSALTARTLEQYLDNKAWAWKNPEHYLGVWIDEGVAYLDVSRFFQDRDEAITFGRDNNQQAIYDSINDEVIFINQPEDDDA